MDPQTPHADPGASAHPPPHCVGCGAPLAAALAGQERCDACHGLVEPEPRAPLRETTVAGYRLVHQLGAGRLATTWLATSAQGQGVVLKLLRPYAPEAGIAQRFLDEARRLSSAIGPGSSSALDHPFVARLLGADVQLGGALILVYEGGGEQTLADELRSRGRLLLPRALELCAQLAEGLDAVHAAGLVHQGLKPANVGLARSAGGDEQAVLLDAATAHLLAHSGLRTPGPLPLSTAAYLSPEVACGTAPGPRADFYALGVLLFQLVSGRLPLSGASSDDLVRAHLHEAPLRLRDAGRRVHADVETTLSRLLAKDPQQRFSSGAELAVVLRALVPVADEAGGDEAGAHPGSADEPSADERDADADGADALGAKAGSADGPGANAGGASEAGANAGGVDEPAATAAAGSLPRPLDAPPTAGVEGSSEPDTIPPPARHPPEVEAALALALLGHVPREPARPLARAFWAQAPAGLPGSLTRGRIAAVACSLAVATSAVIVLRATAPQRGPKRSTQAAAAGLAPTTGPAPAAPSDADDSAAKSDSAAKNASGASRAAQRASGVAQRPAALASPGTPAALVRRRGAQSAPSPGSSAVAHALLGRAARALDQKQPAEAARALTRLLQRNDVARKDRAAAMRLMGAAQAAAGDDAAAVDWYRNSLKLTDDAHERAQTARAIQALKR